MSEINDGGPAFPVALPCLERGMPLRDYFAGQIVLALLSNPNAELRLGSGYHEENGRISRISYILADAMLAARASQQERS